MRASNRKRLPRPLAPGRWLPLALGLGLLSGHDGRAEVPPDPDPATVAAGRELFHREWLPMDPRSHGGDGLGPVYNESSCVACHNLGGPGGAGASIKNVDLLTLELASGFASDAMGGLPSFGPRNTQVRTRVEVRSRNRTSDFTVPTSDQPASGSSLMGDLLISRLSREMTRIKSSASALDSVFAVHPGFRKDRTVTLHQFGTDPAYDPWRHATGLESMGMMGGGRVGVFSSDEPPPRRILLSSVTAPGGARHFGQAIVTRSQRNTTPLFGLGLIDAIPDAVIEAEAARQADLTSATAGRVSRVKGGKIGRLGWKGQTAHLADFVLDACATEVGLEVPGRSQGTPGNAPAKPATGLDLNAEECAALTTFVAALPRPQQRPSRGFEAETIAEGRAKFAAIGCADCHVPDLGSVAGLYSDLLLHDMGGMTASVGSYGGSPGEGDSDEVANPGLVAKRLGPVERGPAPRSTRGASKGEWRTPPLWGVRDSGPYLHDGRAQTLEQAIALHGGQADASSRRYFNLPAEDRTRVEAFLRSLVAPAVAEPVAMR